MSAMSRVKRRALMSKDVKVTVDGVELTCIHVDGYDVMNMTPAHIDGGWDATELPSFHWDDAQQGIRNLVCAAPKMLRLLEKLSHASDSDLPKLRKKARRIVMEIDAMYRGTLTEVDAVDEAASGTSR